jgi:hypothetical protein
MYRVGVDGFEFRGENDRRDDAVDRNDFAEDDGDEILRCYSGCFDTTAEDRGSGDEDAPSQLLFRIFQDRLKSHTMQRQRLTSRCTILSPCWPMRRVICFRETRQTERRVVRSYSVVHLGGEVR